MHSRRRTSSLAAMETCERRILPAAVPFGAEVGDGSEYMLGSVYVTVVMLESDGSIDANLEDWTNSQIADVKQKINDGLQWWEDLLDAQQSSHTLEFQIDFTHADNPVEIPYEPLTRPSTDEDLWIESFLSFVGFETGDDFRDELDQFNHHQRTLHGTNWAFTIFMTDSDNDADGRYTDGRNAWASYRGRTIIQSHRDAATVAHEVGHVFYNLDEYPNGHDYTDARGYYDTQNLNAFDGHPDSDLRVPSLMAETRSTAWQNLTSSPTSLEMVGWRDSDSDGIFDVLDIPLVLTGSGYYDAPSNSFMFSGNSIVQAMPNLNPVGLGNDITLNSVSRVEYSIDGADWINGGSVGGYDSTVSLTVSPIPSDAGQIRIRTIADESGATSNVFQSSVFQSAAVDTTGVNGIAWNDSNGDGTRHDFEPGLADVDVTVRTLQGDIALSEFSFEPDDFDHAEIISNKSQQLSLSAEGSGVEGPDVHARNVSQASTGPRVFAHRLSSGSSNTTWRENRRLRIDFFEPVHIVSIDAVGIFNNSQAMIDAYDSADNLLDTFDSLRFDAGQIVPGRVSGTANDVAYVVVRGLAGKSSFRLDNLQYQSLATSATTSSGSYQFGGIPPGTYRIEAALAATAPHYPMGAGYLIELGPQTISTGNNFGFSAPALQLELSQPSVAESAGASAAMLTIQRVNSTSINEPLVVELFTSDVSEIVLQSAVTIPANRDFVSVPLHAVDDSVPDFDQRVILSAAAAGSTDGAVVLIVVDDEAARAPMDVDQNGSTDASTDGILIIRYLFGFRGDSLINGAVGSGATNATAAGIEAALDGAIVMLDADGNGIRDAATDGILILRYLFGFRDDALVSGAIGAGATRTTGPEVAAFLDGFLPPPPVPPALPVAGTTRVAATQIAASSPTASAPPLPVSESENVLAADMNSPGDAVPFISSPVTRQQNLFAQADDPENVPQYIPEEEFESVDRQFAEIRNWLDVL